VIKEFHYSSNRDIVMRLEAWCSVIFMFSFSTSTYFSALSKRLEKH